NDAVGKILSKREGKLSKLHVKSQGTQAQNYSPCLKLEARAYGQTKRWIPTHDFGFLANVSVCTDRQINKIAGNTYANCVRPCNLKENKAACLFD
ncbi:hypothetical protein BaRGS_00022035, partial [Batillaria attramentaria]